MKQNFKDVRFGKLPKPSEFVAIQQISGSSIIPEIVNGQNYTQLRAAGSKIGGL